MLNKRGVVELVLGLTMVEEENALFLTINEAKVLVHRELTIKEILHKTIIHLRGSLTESAEAFINDVNNAFHKDVKYYYRNEELLGSMESLINRTNNKFSNKK